MDISAWSRIGTNVAVEAAVTGDDVVPGSDLKVMLYLLSDVVSVNLIGLNYDVDV